MGFGSLIDQGAQNSLTSLQQGVNSIGANLENQSAQAQATALQGEAGDVFEQAQVEASQAEIQGKQAYGQQAEQYASSGVELTGTPLDMLNQTRMETAQQVSMIQQQGALQQNLLLEQANQAQQTGLADILGAEGENQVTEQENLISQYQQKMQMLGSIVDLGAGFGRGLFDAVAPNVATSIGQKMGWLP